MPKGAPGYSPNTCEWYDPAHPDYRNLQSMTYDRGNETLGLMLTYTSGRIEELRGLVAIGDPVEDQKVLDTLGAYCDSGEAAAACFNRYEQFALLEVARIRAAMIDNDTSSTDLRSDLARGSVPASQGPLTVGVPANPNAKPNVTQLPTYDELKAQYDRMDAKMRDSITNGFEQDLRTGRSGFSPPKPQDFPAFKKILRNPDKPADGFLYVRDMDAQGNPKVDTKAFQAALKAYRNTNMNQDAQRLHRKLFGAGAAGRGNPSLLLMPPGLDRRLTSTDRRVFGEAQGGIIQELTKDLNKKKSSKGKVSETGKAPAAQGNQAKGNPFDGNARLPATPKGKESPVNGVSYEAVGNVGSVIHDMETHVGGYNSSDLTDFGQQPPPREE